MDRSAVISRIQAGLGFRSDKQAEIILALQEVQRELERAHTLPWFLLEEDQTLSAVADQAYISLPTGFLRFKETEGLYSVDSTTGAVSYLKPKDYDKAREFYATYTPTELRCYALRKDTIYLFPTPTENETLYCSYYKAADTLDADVENAWLANVPDLFIGKAGRIVAEQLRDAGAAAIFGKMEQQWFSWLMTEIANRDEANRSYAVGEEN